MTIKGGCAKIKRVIKMAVLKNDNIPFFQRATYAKPQKMHQAHFHNKHELYFLEKGRTKYFIGDEIFMLEPGDMVFVPAGIFHKTDSGDTAGTSRLLFSFDSEVAGKEFVAELTKNKFIRIPSEKLYILKNIFAQIEQEENKKEQGYREMERLLFGQLLINISRYGLPENEKPLSEQEILVQRIAKYISENFDADLSLDRLSAMFALSPSHLSRLFKKATGVGLNEYINISRITAAEKLLRDTDKSVTQIATECGFNDSNYFAAVFKKLKGTTPKKYSMKKK